MKTVHHNKSLLPSGKPLALLVVGLFALIGSVLLFRSFAATTGTVTTKTGVVTHGAITTTVDTIGWLLTCEPSHELPDDPIVLPGKPGAAHLHDFWGNASTNGNSTVATQEALSNLTVADTWDGSTTKPGTSCDLSTFAPGTDGDTASYWAPVLYANGVKVQPGTKAQLYYRAKPTFGNGFQPFPQDARLIVGSHAATSIATNPGLANGDLYWECAGNSSTHYQLPPNNCGEILANIVYPSCYDGGPMDHTGPNNTDNEHFAYAVNGTCPSGFSIKVPQLSEKFKYDFTPSGANLQLSANPGTTTLLPTYTMHADFWNTWNPASLQYLVTNCINAQISCGTNPFVPHTNPSPTPPPPPPPSCAANPSTPSNVITSQLTTSMVGLSWTASTPGANCKLSGYKIFRGNGSSAPSTTGTPLATTTSADYMDMTVKAATVYTYAIIGYDSNNHSSGAVTITVTTPTSTPIDTTKPTVSLTAPGNGSSVAVGATVNIAATASDNVAVTKVEFYVDGAIKSTDTTSAYSYVWLTTGVTSGTHTLTARAYDAAGNNTTSSAISISLTSPQSGRNGDINSDGRVNALDLSALLSHDGQNYPPADFNHNGTVDAADYAILLANWTW